MKTSLIAAAYAALVISASFGVESHAAGESMRRFALVVGSNNGGPDRVRLRYAVADARAVIAVVRQLGGVDGASSVFLAEPGRSSLLAALAGIRGRILEAKKTSGRIEFIFYYSGHSDEEGLLLRGEKVYYRDLRDQVVKLPADVRIAILDSCSSGAFTRIKGGKMRSPFLVDRSNNMRGVAFMTSSSASEASQESDKIGGSFFTHYLVTGLRGAADTVRDGRVTLNEAYQYAYAETLSRTEKTLRGAQHPNYHIMMSGAGDVVLTDIRRSSASLVLSGPIRGKIRIRDKSHTLVAEFSKPKGREMPMGLDTGRYIILNERDGGLYESSITLKGSERFVLRNEHFSAATREYAVARGDDDPEQPRDPPHEQHFEPFIQKGGFADSWVRFGGYTGAGMPQGGYAGGEKRLLKVMEADLIQAYLMPSSYNNQSILLSGGAEADALFPAIKLQQIRRFNLTGIKLGVRARYGYQSVSSNILKESLYNNDNSSMTMKSSGRLLRYNYWSAGPLVNFYFSPKSNFGGLILGFYSTAGQIFGGRIYAGSALRDLNILGLWTSGAYGPGAPGSRLDLLRMLVYNRTANTARVSGYTIRIGGGPEFALNKWFPVTVGIRATYAFTRLTTGRPLAAYMNGRKKYSTHEVGAEVATGVHF